MTTTTATPTPVWQAYCHQTDRVLFVAPGLAGDGAPLWGTFWRASRKGGEAGGLRRFVSSAAPMVAEPHRAQADLDALAVTYGWKPTAHPEPELLPVGSRAAGPTISCEMDPATSPLPEETSAPISPSQEETQLVSNAYQLPIYAEIPITSVTANPDQPRRGFDEEALAELAESIKVHGILEPLVVRQITSETYQIIAGERRWRAAGLANLAVIPCMIRRADDRQALELALLENLARRDLDPVEEARGYQALIALGHRVTALAQRVGRSQSAVSNAVRLLKLPEEVITMITDGSLSPAHGRSLVRFAEAPAVCRRIAEIAVNRNRTASELDAEKLPFNYELSTEKLVYPLSGGHPEPIFATDACKDCAHYRAVSDWRTYCLDPACAAGKEKAAREALKEGRTDGVRMPEKSVVASELPEGSFAPRLGGDFPAGCRADCPSRQTKQIYGKPCDVCLDPPCFNRLARAEKRQENASWKAERRELAANVLDLISPPDTPSPSSETWEN
jgi:ParB/RepB/Spo0J family partition protein